ncbi:MAG: 3-hydroxyacyl-CoA dehydrogenase family protein [Spirosomataceae bacterium]
MLLPKEFSTSKMSVGVVGLGLMGCSIATCLLAAGHPVVGIGPIPDDMHAGPPRIRGHLEELFERNILKESVASTNNRLTLSEDYATLRDCALVIECTIENLTIKRAVYEKIETVVSPQTAIGSNTSAIPISILQENTRFPARFLGLHWAEPAYTTRFLEVICGNQTDSSVAEMFYEIAHYWGKEPTLVRKDIRGFITNRLSYALYREAFDLVEKGYASIEDIDRACRNNQGFWMTLAGPFRWMDITGIPAYHKVLKELWPTLSNRTDVPPLIQEIVDRGGKGTANADGFYTYTPEEAKEWEKTFARFAFEIRELAMKYPADVVKKHLDNKDTGTPP